MVLDDDNDESGGWEYGRGYMPQSSVSMSWSSCFLDLAAI